MFRNDATEKNKKLVVRLYEECLNKRQWPLLDELMAPDFVNHLAGTRGREAFVRTAKALSEAFADLHFTVEDVFGEGDKVAARWTLRGRHVGPWQTYAPTGKLSEQRVNVIYRVQNGKLAESWLGPGPVKVVGDR
jgi:Predicted ester cyclase